MNTKIKTILLSAFVLFSINSKAQLRVTNSGLVGIGRVPSYNLDVEGTVRFSNWTDVILDWTNPWSAPVLYPEADYGMDLGKSTNRINTLNAYQCFVTSAYNKYSDIRLKKNIGNINSPLSQIRKIKGITYNLNIISSSSNLPKNILASSTKNQFGFIAQDIQKIFPDLVNKSDSSEFLAVDYMGLIPIIVEALKEQDSIISLQSKQIAALTKLVSNNNKLKSAVINNQSTDISIPQVNGALLEQNVPNPFSQSTNIDFYIPESVRNATLYIYEMNGLQLKVFPIQQRGKGYITINGSELRPGMYLYALLADGKEIDTKRMILTE